MRIALWTAVGAAILISCKAIGPVAVEGSRAYDCLGADYDRYTYDERAPIPDACPAGIAIGPVQTTDDGSALEGVVLQVSIVHPSPADVRLWLAYDADKDGKTDARVPLELYKARSERCAGRDPFACPSTLDGVYYFRDDTTRVDGPSLSLFDGLRSGGRFYLGAADTLRDDVGAVRSWSVYVRKPKSALAAFR